MLSSFGYNKVAGVLKVDIKWLKATMRLAMCGVVAFLPVAVQAAAPAPIEDADQLVQMAHSAEFDQSFNARASRNVYSPDSSGTARKSTIVPLQRQSLDQQALLASNAGVSQADISLGDHSGFLGYPDRLTPLNFGQFLIGQLTLAEYSGIWQNFGQETLPDRKCKLHYRDHSFVASGIQCISYFNYVEAHSDDKGILSSISIAGNQPSSQTTQEVLDILGQRYTPIEYKDMPDALKKVADLRNDLCNDLGKLMEGNYKCEDYWFQFRNFFIVFSPSVYKNHRKEQFTYGTLHHFVDYEEMMVKRRLAVVRQELSVKPQSVAN